jgi:predicted PurR-regulated permease PerM
MSTTFRYILIGLGIILAAVVIWYFINIVAYVLISAVLALIGRPIVDMMGSLRIRNIKIPKAINAAVTMILIWGIVIFFFRIFIPLIVSEVNNLSELNPQKILVSLDAPIKSIEAFIDKYAIGSEGKFRVREFLTQKAITIFNVSFITNMFSSFAGILGNVFIAVFSISFITFFFLRDEKLFANAVLAAVPDKYEASFRHAMSSTRHLLMRYFLGILAQITGIFTLVTTGLTIIGVGFGHSLLIGLIAALFNVIPYLGPIIGGTIGVALGIATHLDLEFYSQLLPLIFKMTGVFVTVQLIDNFVFQPLIFSNSVNAHPLEIFIVLLMAGSLAGIAGMILAIPMYTVIRVFAKEFFNKFKVVKKLTKNIQL